jgi:hypothetical protein
LTSKTVAFVYPLLRELSGEQAAGVAVFCSVHPECPDLEVAPT